MRRTVQWWALIAAAAVEASSPRTAAVVQRSGVICTVAAAVAVAATPGDAVAVAVTVSETTPLAAGIVAVKAHEYDAPGVEGPADGAGARARTGEIAVGHVGQRHERHGRAAGVRHRDDVAAPGGPPR